MDKDKFYDEYNRFLDVLRNKRTSIGGIAVHVAKHCKEIIELIGIMEQEALTLIEGVKRFDKHNGIPTKEDNRKGKRKV